MGSLEVEPFNHLLSSEALGIMEMDLEDGMLGNPVVAREILDKISCGTATPSDMRYLDVQLLSAQEKQIDEIMGYGQKT
jgi:hypothetical protein